MSSNHHLQETFIFDDTEHEMTWFLVDFTGQTNSVDITIESVETDWAMASIQDGAPPVM